MAVVLAAACGRAGYIRQAAVFTLLVALALDVQFGWFEKATAYGLSLALLVLFWVLRHHLSTLLATVFGVLLVSTAVVGYSAVPTEEQLSDLGGAPRGAAAAQGRIVHLLFDEHAGLQGIPADLPGGQELRRDLEAFFTTNGFRLYGNAISEYEASRNSISGILNFAAGPQPYERYEGGRPYVLTQSAYFAALSEAGYGIDVYQSRYMDFCGAFADIVGRCYTYSYDGTRWLTAAPVGDMVKLKALFAMYVQLSEIAEALLKSYARLELSLRESSFPLPAVPELEFGPSPVNGMLTLDRFIDDVVTGEDGKLYFAHILMPHGPYLFDADCRMRDDFSTWVSNRPPYRKQSTESERQRRYGLYFGQLRCAMARMQSLFDRLKAAGLFETATIIVHGDHGSRIYQTAPRAWNRERMTPQDFRDAYATLFAVKAPGIAAGRDDAVLPASRLLAGAIGRADLVQDPGAPAQIYLEGDDDDAPWTAVPWPAAE